MLAYVRTYGTDALITRGANTYGPRQYPEKFLPLFITNAFDGLPLPVYGDGRQRREWLHVDDHCAAIEIALRKGAGGEVYNIGGQERENMDVVRRILDLTGASPDLVRHVTDRPGHDRRYAVDSSKLRGLGWTPQHSFEAGGLEAHRRLVSREPRLVGADQVGRLPRVLRRAVRGTPDTAARPSRRLSGPFATVGRVPRFVVRTAMLCLLLLAGTASALLAAGPGQRNPVIPTPPPTAPGHEHARSRRRPSRRPR